MSGALGVALSLLTIAAVFILQPGESLGISPSATVDLAKVALLLCLAALSSALGLLSPYWSPARVAAIWGSALAAALTIAVNMNTLTEAAMDGLPPTAVNTQGREIAVPTGSVRLREGIMPEYDPSPEVAPGIDDPSPAPAEQAQVLLMAARTTEIKAGARGHFFTTAEIDHTPIVVLIDTGASMVAMSYEDADKAGLKPFSLDYGVPVATANGIVKAAPAMLKRVEIDTIVIRDVEALVMPEGVLKGTLLGMSFLSRLSGFGIRNGVLVLEE
jgi:aspartyl protease family protein